MSRSCSSVTCAFLPTAEWMSIQNGHPIISGFIQHDGSHHAAPVVEMNERSTPLFEMTKVQEDLAIDHGKKAGIKPACRGPTSCKQEKARGSDYHAPTFVGGEA